MPYDPTRHHRRSIHLPGHDYRQAGGYFVTINTHDRALQAIRRHICNNPARWERDHGNPQRAGRPIHDGPIKHRALLLVLLLLLGSCSLAPSAGQGATPPPAVAVPTTSAPRDVSPPPQKPAQVGEEERWIEVDLAQQRVRLRQGTDVLAEYPAAAGAGISPETTTYTGMFIVQSKEKGPVESVPGVFVTDVVMFDWGHGNAFHSRPMDKDGRVLDERLGQPLTAGCVRTAESAAVFDFATLGMKVWVH